MAETIREFFERRKRELSNRSVALRGELTAIEAELAEIAAAEAALPSRIVSAQGTAEAVGGAAATGNFSIKSGVASDATVISGGNLEGLSDHERRLRGLPTTRLRYVEADAPNQNPTIRDLILVALRNFPNGAKISEVRQFVTDAYSRDIDRASFSPQLSRLKQDGRVTLNEQSGKWKLVDVFG